MAQIVYDTTSLWGLMRELWRCSE